MPAIGHRGDQSSREWGGSVQIHHLSERITQVSVLCKTNQPRSLSAQRWGCCKKEPFLNNISIIFFKGDFPPLVLKINADWCLLRDWGSLKIWCPVILGVGRSKFQVLGKTCRVLETGHLGEWCQAREGSMKQLGSSGEAETTRSSWTNAGGQGVFVDTDFSPSVPIWEETSKPITQQKHRVDFLCLTPLPRCWPRTDRSSVGPMPFENGVTFLLHVLFLE